MTLSGIPKGLSKKWKIQTRGGGEGGVNDYGILRAWGYTPFWNFQRQGREGG